MSRIEDLKVEETDEVVGGVAGAGASIDTHAEVMRAASVESSQQMPTQGQNERSSVRYHKS